MSLSFVTKRGFAVVGADATGLRTKVGLHRRDERPKRHAVNS
jgi:hypothetical protein